VSRGIFNYFSDINNISRFGVRNNLDFQPTGNPGLLKRAGLLYDKRPGPHLPGYTAILSTVYNPIMHPMTTTAV
jgi:hypothetical protein